MSKIKKLVIKNITGVVFKDSQIYVRCMWQNKKQSWESASSVDCLDLIEEIIQKIDAASFNVQKMIEARIQEKNEKVLFEQLKKNKKSLDVRKIENIANKDVNRDSFSSPNVSNCNLKKFKTIDIQNQQKIEFEKKLDFFHKQNKQNIEFVGCSVRNSAVKTRNDGIINNKKLSNLAEINSKRTASPIKTNKVNITKSKWTQNSSTFEKNPSNFALNDSYKGFNNNNNNNNK
ncbi:hypothetical protein EDEG_03449 [Edhazardia aedis USNM 41457]|uniref:Chromo domain-containing protein n=1 Tax=Edhazardia aedis (strain USNM 41457) TaxID=1003232 RepID=J9D3H3_EDHAE|nr:hypothetical protein EDEG_03449 [Edhazardia aedis USNM 41457]|eukprot:EJW02089.1 hypothetical protein EDEG_03449 [Edhazardia aedis USNM 41457]